MLGAAEHNRFLEKGFWGATLRSGPLMWRQEILLLSRQTEPHYQTNTSPSVPFPTAGFDFCLTAMDSFP